MTHKIVTLIRWLQSLVSTWLRSNEATCSLILPFSATTISEDFIPNRRESISRFEAAFRALTSPVATSFHATRCPKSSLDRDTPPPSTITREKNGRRAFSRDRNKKCLVDALSLHLTFSLTLAPHSHATPFE